MEVNGPEMKSTGTCRFWYSWRSQIEALQDSYEVAAIDLPGYNASGKLTNVAHYVTQDVCRIIAGVLNGLCRESCILVGTAFTSCSHRQHVCHGNMIMVAMLNSNLTSYALCGSCNAELFDVRAALH